MIASKRNLIAGLAATLVMAAYPAWAQTAAKFDLANENPASSLPAQSELRFIEHVKQKTNGSVQITPHFGGALGYDSRTQFTAVRDGAVALGSSPLDKFVGLAPVFALQSLPFVTPTIDSTEVLFKIARPHYELAFNKANQTLLLSEPWTPQGIWAKKKITSIDDLKALKVRSYDATGTRTLARAGLAPVQLSSSDVVPALTTNTIAGVLTSDESGVNGRYWELGARYFNFLGYTMGISVVTMNLDAYNRLTTEQQKGLREAAAAAEAEAWQAARARVDQNKKVMSEQGAIFVDDVPQSVIEHVKRAGAPEIENWKKQMGSVGEEIMAEFDKRSR